MIQLMTIELDMVSGGDYQNTIACYPPMPAPLPGPAAGGSGSGNPGDDSDPGVYQAN